jgi:hypothetical protein
MIIRHLQSVKVLLVLEFRPVIVTFTTVTNKPKIMAAVLIRLVAFFLFAVVLPLDAKMANNDMLTA